MTIEHSTLTGAQLHESKGTAGATAGQIFRGDGLGSGSFKTPIKVIQQAIYDYNDLTTVSTPISLATADTDFELTYNYFPENNNPIKFVEDGCYSDPNAAIQNKTEYVWHHSIIYRRY